jgi:hypothetical protein
VWTVPRSDFEPDMKVSADTCIWKQTLIIRDILRHYDILQRWPNSRQELYPLPVSANIPPAGDEQNLSYCPVHRAYLRSRHGELSGLRVHTNLIFLG